MLLLHGLEGYLYCEMLPVITDERSRTTWVQQIIVRDDCPPILNEALGLRRNQCAPEDYSLLATHCVGIRERSISCVFQFA